MIKLLLIALLAVPAAAFAQVRVAPSAGALAWSGPIASAVSEAGVGGIAQLESMSMTRLSSPGTDGRLPLVSSPELLNPLVETLEASAVSPAEFPDLPLEFKMSILRTAASLTEDRLGMKVWEIVLNTNKGIGRSAIAEVTKEAAKARETSLYLNERTIAGLEMLEQRVKDFEAAREAARLAFLADLPAKIAAGEFNAENFLQTEDDGGRTLWKTAGDSPERAYPTAEAALDARVEALTSMPAGAWSIAEAELLEAALYANMKKGVLSPSRWTVSATNAIHAARVSGVGAALEPGLRRAVHRIAGDRATASDVLAIEKAYEAAHGRPGLTWTARARILATIKTGFMGQPSWERLASVKNELGPRLERLGLIALLTAIGVALLVSVLPLKALLPAAWLAAGSVALLAGMFVPLAVAFWTFFRRAALSAREAGSLARAMSAYFSRKP